MPEETITTRPPLNINSFLTSRLSYRDYKPTELDPRSNRLAVLATNERVDTHIYDQIKRKGPNGYIVAVGSGLSLSLPSTFKKESPPKGVVLIDIDRKVTAITRAFVNALKANTTYEEFYENFYSNPIEKAEGFLSDSPEDLNTIRTMSSGWADEIESQIDRSKRESAKVIENDRVSLYQVLSRDFELWRQLAINDQIAIINGSFVDKSVAEAVTALPEYEKSTNLIYLSNIADHIVDKHTWEKCDQTLNEFQAGISMYNPKSNPAIYLDTLRGFNYWVRVTKGIPSLIAADFRLSSPYLMPENLRLKEPLKKKRNYSRLDMNTVPKEKLVEMKEERLAEIFTKYKNLDQRELRQMVLELADFIIFNESAGPKYFGNKKPLDWANDRFGPLFGEAIAIEVTIRKKSRPPLS